MPQEALRDFKQEKGAKGSSLVAQQLKDLALSLLWLWLLLWCVFNPWPRIFRMLWVQPRKERKRCDGICVLRD